MDIYFYSAIAVLLFLEWLHSKRTNGHFDVRQVIANVSCTVLIVIAQPITEKTYVSMLSWLMTHE